MINIIYIKLRFYFLWRVIIFSVFIIFTWLNFILKINKVVLVVKNAIDTFKQLAVAWKYSSTHRINETSSTHLIWSGKALDNLIYLLFSRINSRRLSITRLKRSDVNPGIGAFTVQNVLTELWNMLLLLFSSCFLCCNLVLLSLLACFTRN